MSDAPAPGSPEPSGPRFGFAAAWAALTRSGKITTTIVGALVVLFVIGAAASTGSGEKTTTITEAAAPVAPADDSPDADDSANADVAPAPATTETPATTVAAPAAPAPQVFSGTGSKVINVRFPDAGTPVIVTARHTGQSNFIVGTVSGGGFINEIGVWSGTTLVSGEAGPTRINVDADGSWSLRFQKVVENPNAASLPHVFTGTGEKVIQVKAGSDLEQIVSVNHHGESNFIVNLVPVDSSDGFGGNSLANEIGDYSGEQAVEVGEGAYLLHVDADGRWTVAFRN